jgi:hypothetical protein
MIAMVITCVILGMITKGKWDTVNSEYIVANNKYYHLSYTYLFGYINFYYEYKSQTKASLIANGHTTPTSDWYKKKSYICENCIMNT